VIDALWQAIVQLSPTGINNPEKSGAARYHAHGVALMCSLPNFSAHHDNLHHALSISRKISAAHLLNT